MLQYKEVIIEQLAKMNYQAIFIFYLVKRVPLKMLYYKDVKIEQLTIMNYLAICLSFTW